MQNFLAANPDAAGVRFGVRKTGCSGFAYMVDVADSIAANDQVFEQDGVRLVIDTKSLPFVDGTEIDFAAPGPERGVRVPQSRTPPASAVAARASRSSRPPEPRPVTASTRDYRPINLADKLGQDSPSTGRRASSRK